MQEHDLSIENPMERLVEDPRPLGNAILLDLWDQCEWNRTKATAGVSSGLICERVGPVEHVLAISTMKRDFPWVRDEAIVVALNITGEALFHLLSGMRRFHLFEISDSGLTVDGEPILRVPAGAAERLREPSLAVDRVPSHAEVQAALHARYAP